MKFKVKRRIYFLTMQRENILPSTSSKDVVVEKKPNFIKNPFSSFFNMKNVDDSEEEKSNLFISFIYYLFS